MTPEAKIAPLLLIVDDHDAGRFVKSQTLRRAGFRIIESSTGNDALHQIATAAPDLVVLDVNLPDINGLEVSRRIRTEHATIPALQILQISSTAVAPHDQVLGLETGADVYLTEPVPPEVLVATVHALLRVRQAETALAAALERERDARNEAERAAQLRDEFIATLSHELRTPLNAVMGWIWQLRHLSLEPEARTRALDSLERNARLQVQLISDLLDVSRIAKGKLLLELTRLDLRELVRDALESVSAQVAAKALTVEITGDTSTLIADHGRLQQIVINLLTNAIQFTPTAGRVTLAMTREGDTALLSVVDTGVGIDADMLASVFDQFQQGPGGQARKHGGLGLGLAVVRQLTELHGGSITVESAGRGHGTSFRLRLPREDDGPQPPTDLLPVLSGVRIAVDMATAEQAESLKAMLEVSGAEVLLTGEDASAAALLDTCAACVSNAATPAAGCLHVDFPVQQADLVRRLARQIGTRGRIES